MGLTFFVEDEHMFNDEDRQWSCTYTTAHNIVWGLLGIKIEEAGLLNPKEVRTAALNWLATLMDSVHDVQPDIAYKLMKLIYICGLAVGKNRMISYG